MIISCRIKAATVHEYQFGVGWICRQTHLHGILTGVLTRTSALAVRHGLPMSMSICPGHRRLLEVSQSPLMGDAGL